MLWCFCFLLCFGGGGGGDLITIRELRERLRNGGKSG